MKKVSFYILLLFFVLFLTEISLQLIGFSLRQYQNFINSRNNSSGYTILTIGESTTADTTSIKYTSWPRTLEAKLKEKNFKVNVINIAKPGTNSNQQLRELKKVIEDKKVDVLISMMGINDNPRLILDKKWIFSENNFLDNFKIFKLTKFLINDLNKQNKRFVINSNLNFTNSMELISKIKRNENLSNFKIDQEIDQLLLNKSNLEKAQFLSFLGYSLMPSWGSKPEQFKLAQKFHRKSLEQSPWIKEQAEIAATMDLVLSQDCSYILDLIDIDDYHPSEILINRLWSCNQSNKLRLIKYMNKFYPEYNLNELQNINPTKNNFQQIAEYLNMKNICFVVMQYPTLSITPLKEYFSEIKSANKIIFIENKDNFKSAIDRYGFDSLFYDNFAGSFGHTTDQGVSFILENLMPEIENILTTGKCLQ